MIAKPGKYNISIVVESTELGNEKLRKNTSVGVRRCTIGEASKNNGMLCKKCEPLTFNFNLSENSCRTCPPQGAHCPGPTVTP